MALSFTVEQLAVALGIEDDGEAWRTRPIDHEALGVWVSELGKAERDVRDWFMVRSDEASSKLASAWLHRANLLPPGLGQARFAHLHLPAR